MRNLDGLLSNNRAWAQRSMTRDSSIFLSLAKNVAASRSNSRSFSRRLLSRFKVASASFEIFDVRVGKNQIFQNPRFTYAATKQFWRRRLDTIAAEDIARRVVAESQPLLENYAGIVAMSDVEVVRDEHF